MKLSSTIVIDCMFRGLMDRIVDFFNEISIFLEKHGFIVEKTNNINYIPFQFLTPIDPHRITNNKDIFI